VPRKNARRELVEKEILGHAIALFAERGFAGTNLQDIADATGLTRPALYHYVSSKEDLLAQLVRQVIDDVADTLLEVAGDGSLSATERLRAVVRGLAQRQLTEPERFRLLIKSEAELPAELAKAYTRARRRVLKAFVDVIEAGIRADEFRPVDARSAALGVIGMCNWIAWWHHPGNAKSDEAIADQFADFAVAGLEQPHRRETGGGDEVEQVIGLLRADLARLERVVASRDGAAADDGAPA
jgi:AcrR family transcriptional regulator